MIHREEILADGVRLICGDCREVLPSLGRVDAVVTDPPYGIGKAEWDTEFPLEWFDLAARLSDLIAIMPGTWNLAGLPKDRAGLRYKWTLSAHLVNGMTKGGFGWGNWIPCVVYHSPAQPQYVQQWCRRFSQWCTQHNVGKKQLDFICGTSDMAGWYLGLLPHRCQIPAPHQWAKIVSTLDIPDDLTPLWTASDYEPQTDCKAFAVGREPKPDHPSPKPLNVMRWFLETIGGRTILDPFMGSGTTGVAAVKLGRKFIGIEIEPKYFDIACRRVEEALRQPDLFIEKPRPVKQETFL